MSAKLPVDHTNSLVLKDSTPNEASCPSLASDSFSQGSDSVGTLNTESERRHATALGQHGHLDLEEPDRLFVWSKWLEEEPNPVYERTGRSRGRHVWNLCTAVSVYAQKFTEDEAIVSGSVDSPKSRGATGDELVDGSERKRGPGTGQAPTKRRNTSRPYAQKTRLSEEITSPRGSDGARLLLGHGVFDAREGEWHFMCYWFKRNPMAHPTCAMYHVQEERSVRVNHALWHKDRNDIKEETYQHIKYLECAEFTYLPRPERGAAVWREAYAVVFPDHRIVRHLLNPFIGDLFSDRARAEGLLAVAGSLLVRSLPALLASPLQITEQDSPTATQTPRPMMNVATFAADANVIAQEEPSPAHEGDGIALDGHHRPFAMPSDPFQPILLSTSGLPQLANPMTAILALLGQVERVEHDPRRNTYTITLPLPIDPRLESAPSNAPTLVHNVHDSLPAVSELQPQFPTEIGQTRSHGGAIQGDNRQIVQHAAPERVLQAAVSAHTTHQQLLPSSQSAPSLITDNTYISGPVGTSPTVEPRTPEETDMPPNQSRHMILSETSQQDKAKAGSQNESIASPGHIFDDYINYDG